MLNVVPLPAKVKNPDKNVEQDIMKFLDNRLLNPLSQNIISEKLILMLLKIIISYGSVIDFFISINSTLIKINSTQQVNSKNGIVDLSSPENQIAKLLMLDFNNSSAILNPNTVYSPSSQINYENFKPDKCLSIVEKSEVYAKIESLLVCGLREEAVDFASDNSEWGIAFVIGAVCSPEKYKELVLKFSNKNFPSNSTLNSLTQTFANQPIQFSSFSEESNKTLLDNWRRTVASILANKLPGWDENLVLLGDRIHSGHCDVMTSHFRYLCAGKLPAAPSPSSKFNLMGYNYNSDPNKNFFQINSLNSFRMTEILEWAILRARDKSKSKSDSKNGGIVKSLSGMFGMSQQPTTNANVDTLSNSENVIPFEDNRVK
jgi:hypothetical protein